MSTRPLTVLAPARPDDVRRLNRASILERLFQDGPASRAQLARATGLTRVTISAQVDDLLTEGLVVELGPEESTGRAGRRGTVLSIATPQWELLALDLTGTSGIRGAVVDLAGNVRIRLDSAEPLLPGPQALTQLFELGHSLLALTTKPILGLGVSCPGLVSTDGRVIQAANRGWYDLPLAARLEAELGVRTHVANDANTSALAEHAFGSSSPDGLLALVVGSGVGAGLIISGHLLLGSRNAVGEIGHVTAVDAEDAAGPLGTPRECACGRRGCLETIASEPALRAVVEAAGADRAGDSLAAVGRRLGRALAPVVAALDVSDVVLGGPPDLLGGPLLAALDATLESRILPVRGARTRVRLTGLGPDRPLLGAAALVTLDVFGAS